MTVLDLIIFLVGVGLIEILNILAYKRLDKKVTKNGSEIEKARTSLNFSRKRELKILKRLKNKSK